MQITTETNTFYSPSPRLSFKLWTSPEEEQQISLWKQWIQFSRFIGVWETTLYLQVTLQAMMCNVNNELNYCWSLCYLHVGCSVQIF